MPLPEFNLYPAFNTVRLSHIELVVTDLAASRHFYVDTLGLQVTHEDSNQIFLRAMEERGHHCVILTRGETPCVRYTAYKVWDEADLDRAQDYFEAKGIETSWAERPFQGRTLRLRDNHGVPIEFYRDMERLPTITQKYALYRGVRPLRIDHFNVFSPNVDESVAFYNDFGFRTTEYTEDEETGALWAAWLHRKGGVHDVAFTNGMGPRMHHTAFWVPTPLAIIDLLDIMATTGYVDNIERGPGRHGISNAFFLYVLDPDGHRTEIYCSDYQTLDPDHEPIRWDLKDKQRQTLWGAPAPRSWFEHGMPFEGQAAREPDLTASPIIAP